MIAVPWLVFLVVWIAGARSGKRTTRRETMGERAFHVIGTAAAAGLVMGSPLPSTAGMPREIGILVCAAGLAFAIWARVILGTNWSGMITLKEDHELIQRGPYALARHPIYTGILLGLLGSTIYTGRPRGYLGVVTAFVTFWRKGRIEETFMVDYFGDRYRDYRRRVKALIPGLL